MENKVLAVIEKYKMVSPGDNILVALSGGADSVALFYCMLQLREALKINVYAAHLNHGLRGEESDRDELFTKQLCKSFKTEIFTRNAHMAERTAPKGMGTEKWARELRYAFLQETAEALNAKIATAHTLSDNCETLIFNLTRGSSLKGSSGIPPVRGNIIRPLIEVTRAETEAYCEKNALSYVTDSTNLTDDYSRNKIRHNVMPVLCEISGGAQTAMGRFTEGQRSLYDFVERQTKAFLNEIKLGDNKYDTQKFIRGDRLLQQFAVAEIISEYTETEHKKLELCISAVHNTGRVQLQSKKAFFADKKIFGIEEIDKIEKPMYEIRLKDALNQKCLTLDGDYKIHIQKGSCKEIINFHKINKKALNYIADYGKIQDNILFRTRRTGDRFALPRRGCTKTVKKLFSELGIPVSRREQLPLLADGNKVIWIYGIGFADGFAADESCGEAITVYGESL